MFYTDPLNVQETLIFAYIDKLCNAYVVKSFKLSCFCINSSTRVVKLFSFYKNIHGIICIYVYFTHIFHQYQLKVFCASIKIITIILSINRVLNKHKQLKNTYFKKFFRVNVKLHQREHKCFLLLC